MSKPPRHHEPRPCLDCGTPVPFDPPLCDVCIVTRAFERELEGYALDMAVQRFQRSLTS